MEQDLLTEKTMQGRAETKSLGYDQYLAVNIENVRTAVTSVNRLEGVLFKGEKTELECRRRT